VKILLRLQDSTIDQLKIIRIKEQEIEKMRKKTKKKIDRILFGEVIQK
jgi:hypothetical protein